MSKMIETNEIEKTIYDYEMANKIYEKTYWGDDPENNYFAINGETAMMQAAEKGIIIGGGSLSADVCYIFRWTLKHDKIMPYHVSMRRKTKENIMKGGSRYGSMSIMQEIANG